MSALPLVDDSTQLASIIADPQRTINLFVERTQPGNTKTQGYLRKRPCLSQFTIDCGDGPIRGLFAITTYRGVTPGTRGSVFAVAGSHFIEIDSSGTILGDYGTVADDGLPVSMTSNGSAGNQILIISGGLGYVFDLVANTLSGALPADFPADALQCDFMDGYGIVSIHNTRRFQISALEDFTSWDPLDVAERSIASDNIRQIIRNHRELWIRGDLTSEVWYDNGDPLFPFAPIQGVFVENGAIGPFSGVRADNTTVYVDRDERGQAIVRKMDGYTPTRVSTYAVETNLGESKFGRLDFAQMFAAQFTGHLFIVLFVDDLDWSWVYDVAENKWFQWAHWDPTECEYFPLVCTTHAFQFNEHLVGDRRTDTIYKLSFDNLTDDLVTP